jgi:cytochrome c oxidase assembly factor CtaG
MTTFDIISSYWQFNVAAIVLAAVLVVLHIRSNGNWLTHTGPLFLTALALLLLVTMSPLASLGHEYLFSAHMIQHVILLLIIPPLLLTGIDKKILTGLAQQPWFKKTGNILFKPSVSWLFGVGSMWVLHIPAVYTTMAKSPVLMSVQMLLLLFFGIIFIWPVYAPVPLKKLDPLESVVYLFTACIGCTILGILITFTPFSLYGACLTGQNPEVLALIRFNWGITPDVDQQAGGLIMWVPACMVYLTNIIITLGRWLVAPDREEARELFNS